MDSKHYRSLDLLRALAIGLVITAHTVSAQGSSKYWYFGLGGTGVDLFFVLSGWLLGNQLVREYNDTKNINLSKFWIRRWMRTLPAYYVVLFFTIFQQIVIHPENPLKFEYILFIQNYTNLPYFGVSWSLCVEEQFYLIIAPIILLFAKIGRYFWSIVIIILIIPFTLRMFGVFNSLTETHVRIDGCMAGVALAALSIWMPYLWKWFTRWSPFFAGIGALLYIGNFLGRWRYGHNFHDFDISIYVLIFCSFIILASRNDWWQKHLYIPGANYIATRAYSLYLLHPEVLAILKRFFPKLSLPLFYIIALAGSCIMAEGLYRLVEKPIMNARNKFSISHK